MSVSSDFDIPSQPSDGEARFIPLGGDGRTAPSHQYYVVSSLDGDVSGGIATVRIGLDPRYSHMIDWINPQVEGSTGDVLCRVTQAFTDEHFLRSYVTCKDLGFAPSGPRAGVVLSPPSTMMGSFGASAIACVFPNVNGETYEVQLSVYAFDIRARELTPIPFLTMTKPAAGSTF